MTKVMTGGLRIIFVLKMLSAFTSATYIHALVKLDFFMEANTMNPDQTACSIRSSLIWVHVVCNIGYPRT